MISISPITRRAPASSGNELKVVLCSDVSNGSSGSNGPDSTDDLADPGLVLELAWEA